MNQLTSLSFLLCLILVNTEAENCVAGWHEYKDGSCIQVSTEPKTFADASAFCKAKSQEEDGNGADFSMVTIQTDEMQEFLTQITVNTFQSVWQGGKYDKTKEKFYLEDGKEELVYFSWAQDYPNNPINEDSCIVLRPVNESRFTLNWEHVTCNGRRLVACQRTWKLNFGGIISKLLDIEKRVATLEANAGKLLELEAKADKLLDLEAKADKLLDVEAKADKLLDLEAKADKLLDVEAKADKLLELEAKADKLLDLEAKADKLLDVEAKADKLLELEAKADKLLDVEAKADKLLDLEAKADKLLDLEAKADKLLDVEAKADKLLDLEAKADKLLDLDVKVLALEANVVPVGSVYVQYSTDDPSTLWSDFKWEALPSIPRNPAFRAATTPWRRKE